MEDVNKRIEKLLIQKGLSASEFSKKINIQRSSVSHILNGRNKPSLEVITKICKVFPDVKLNWLVLGENNKNPSSPTQIKSKNIDNTNSSDVEKIILLLKDGTFKTFENQFFNFFINYWLLHS